jgi:inward rectifier potassium channel
MSAAATPSTIARPRPAVQTNMPSIVRVGSSSWTMGDLYHSVLTMRWGFFLVLVVGIQLTANLLFAALFSLQSDNITNAPTFIDKFYFSVQTWATIGYGGMTPTTTFANMLVVAESITGIVATAVTTGLVFAKFARPSARVLFANQMITQVRDGQNILMIRVANERGNNVVEASARVTLLRNELSREGEVMRRLYDLKLMRDVQPLFMVSWTIMHIIDEASPLWGKSAEDIIAEDWRINVNLQGYDGTLAQTIHASHFYRGHDVAFNHRYVDVMSTLPDGRMQIDLAHMHDVEPMTAKAP